MGPHSNRAVSRVGSASVAGPDLGLADALATAVAAAGEPDPALIESRDGYDALVIGPDDSKRSTEGSLSPRAAEHRDERAETAR